MAPLEFGLALGIVAGVGRKPDTEAALAAGNNAGLAERALDVAAGAVGIVEAGRMPAGNSAAEVVIEPHTEAGGLVGAGIGPAIGIVGAEVVVGPGQTEHAG